VLEGSASTPRVCDPVLVIPAVVRPHLVAAPVSRGGRVLGKAQGNSLRRKGPHSLGIGCVLYMCDVALTGFPISFDPVDLFKLLVVFFDFV